MTESSRAVLIKERVAQLHAISARRNELLRQMYHLIQQRNNVGALLPTEAQEEDEPGLHKFLQRFDLTRNGNASIANLTEDEWSPIPLVVDQDSKAAIFILPDLTSLTPQCETTYDQFQTFSPNLASYSVPPLGASPESKLPLSLESTLQVSSSKPQLAEESEEDHDKSSIPILDESLGAPTSVSPSSTSPAEIDAHKEKLPPVSPVTFKSTKEEAADIQDVTMEEDGVPVQLPSATSITQLSTTIQEPVESMDVDEDHRDFHAAMNPEGNREDIREDEITVVSGVRHSQALELDATSEEVLINSLSDSNYSEGNEDPELLSTAVTHSLSTLRPISLAPVLTRPPQRPIIIATPSAPPINDQLFQLDMATLPELSMGQTSPPHPHYQSSTRYTLPPINVLPPEFVRKAKTLKQRKRDKEREKTEGKKEKEDLLPLGLNRWAATLSANPVWKKVSRASKCLNSRDWAVAMTELRLIRTLDRVEFLKDGGRWSFRQPKKQRGVGGLAKTHWDYLMDEMKWMRIDFREERKWKMALAYALSTAVLEWHAMDSWEERILCGVCVKWKSSYSSTEAFEDDGEAMDIDDTQPQKKSLVSVNYGSDDDDDDEQDKDAQSVVDPLEPAAMIEDALDTASHLIDGVGENTVQPKMEDFDDLSALQNESETTNESIQGMPTPSQSNVSTDVATGLKSTSHNPVLGSKSSSQSSSGDSDPVGSSVKAIKPIKYGLLRENIAYADDEKLFLNSNDVTQSSNEMPNYESAHSLDLDALFPDLQPLCLLDVTPATVGIEGKKKLGKNSDRDDPNKRIEETTYTKLYPTDKFMFAKPTLIGPLLPSKRWKDSTWLPMEEMPVVPDSDGPMKIPDDSGNDLFDVRSSNGPAILAFQVAKDKGKRGVDHIWSASDDTLLRSLSDKYPNNWALIAECFNGSRLTTPTDRRSASDCLERWKEKWGPEMRQRPLEIVQAPLEETVVPSTPSQMTTRGVKRLASSSVSSQNAPIINSGSEPKKRRRHLLLQDSMRKAAKKRVELAQKMVAGQRKTPAIHETHGQYSKMPKLTPAELSRMKAEKDARDVQDLALARRRQEELARQNLLREQSQRIAVPPVPATQAPLSQQQPQPQPQQQQQQQQQLSQIQQSQIQHLQQLQLMHQASQAQRVNSAGSLSNARPGVGGSSRISTPSLATNNRLGLTAQQVMQLQAIGGGSAILSGHLPTNHQFTKRDATNSPSQASPPHGPVVPPSGVNSPRPEQTNHVQGPQVPGSGIARPTSSLGNQYYPATAAYIPDQVTVALRLQMLQQQQLLQQQQQAQQQHQQAQGFPNSS